MADRAAEPCIQHGDRPGFPETGIRNQRCRDAFPDISGQCQDPRYKAQRCHDIGHAGIAGVAQRSSTCMGVPVRHQLRREEASAKISDYHTEYPGCHADPASSFSLLLLLLSV